MSSQTYTTKSCRAPLVLVSKLTEDTVEVITPYSYTIECPQGFMMYPASDEGLKGNRYIIEGTHSDTLKLTLKGREAHELIFEI